MLMSVKHHLTKELPTGQSQSFQGGDVCTSSSSHPENLSSQTEVKSEDLTDEMTNYSQITDLLYQLEFMFMEKFSSI